MIADSFNTRTYVTQAIKQMYLGVNAIFLCENVYVPLSSFQGHVKHALSLIQKMALFLI